MVTTFEFSILSKFIMVMKSITEAMFNKIKLGIE